MKEKIFSSCASAFLLVLIGASCAFSDPTEVFFDDRLKTVNNLVYAKGDVFDEILILGDKEIILNGKDFSLTAGKVKVVGKFIIRAFPEGSAPNPQGGVPESRSQAKTGAGCSHRDCPQHGSVGDTGFTGNQGDEGFPGRSAGRVELSFHRLEGDGSIEIYNNGEAGGKGQNGGIGGVGGNGGPGRKRQCYEVIDLFNHRDPQQPGNGGDGGQGGTGGRGGTGGPGGNGGMIIYDSDLSQWVDSEQILLVSQGGNGGPGGDGGEPGNGGPGGSAGGGNICGGGGNPGKQGPKGSSGNSGYPGLTGNSGPVVMR